MPPGKGLIWLTYDQVPIKLKSGEGESGKKKTKKKNSSDGELMTDSRNGWFLSERSVFDCQDTYSTK